MTKDRQKTNDNKILGKKNSPTDAKKTPDSSKSTQKTEKDVNKTPSETPSASEKNNVEALLKKVRQDLADRDNQILYFRAEIENLKKRAVRIRQESSIAAQEAVWKAVFPVYVNLRRAVDSFSNHAPSMNQITEGVDLTLKVFHQLFEQFDLKVITGVSCPFDPHIHEALTTEERTDVDSTVVLEEYEPGFMISNRLVRPARVKVGIAAKTKEDQRPAEEEKKDCTVSGHKETEEK